MAEAKRDNNFIPTLLGVSNADSTTPVAIEADPTTKRLLVNSTFTGTISATVTSSDGAITDGVSSTIRASVLDYSNSKPIAVRLTDTSGDYVSAGAGTQYANNTTSATPTGTVALGFDGGTVRAMKSDTDGTQVSRISAGTVSLAAGSLTIGTVTVGNLLNGTVRIQSGTVTTVTTVSTLTNMTNGTVSTVSTVANLTNGTISTVANLTNGTVNLSRGAADVTSVVYDGATAVTPSFGTITFSTLGNNVALGTIAAKRIRVVAMNFTNGTATNIYITDSAGATLWGNSSNTGQFAANSGIVLPYNPVGWFQTGSGNALIFNLSTTSSVAGSFSYLQI